MVVIDGCKGEGGCRKGVHYFLFVKVKLEDCHLHNPNKIMDGNSL